MRLEGHGGALARHHDVDHPQRAQLPDVSHPLSRLKRGPMLPRVAFATLVGLIDNLAGHVELDALLVPLAWSPVQ
jgi:hypothetical protein